MRLSFVPTAILLAVVCSSLSTEARAATVFSLLEPGVNQASDEDREYLIDRNFNGIPLGQPGSNAGQIDVGDSLRGHIDFNTLNSSSANLGGATGNSELSGVFQALVVAKTTFTDAFGNTQYAFVFGADPAFAEGLGTVGGAPVIVLWQDNTPDFAADFDDPAAGALASLADDGTPHTAPHPGTGPGHTPPSAADVSSGAYATEEAFISTAVDGERFVTLGFSGQAGEGLVATTSSGSDNVLPAFGTSSGTSFATNNFALSVLDGPGFELFDLITLGTISSPFPPPGGTPGFIGVVGSQQFRGVADLDTSFEVSTNTNVSFNVVGAVIPEPSSYLLLSFGSLALFAIRRRRMNEAKQS